MAKKDNLRQGIFDKYKTNLNLLQDNSLITNYKYKDVYVCPLCLVSYSELKKEDLLTFEDAPPKELGGKYDTLTCAKCNNDAGAFVDFHFVERLREMERPMLLPDTENPVIVDTIWGDINARLRVGADRVMKMLLPPKFNNPKVLEPHIDNVKGGDILNFKFKDSKVDLDRVEYSILKSAYMLLFEKIGYLAILQPCFDRIRLQIRHPEKRIIGKGFWGQRYTDKIKDGVYLIKNEGMECFAITFSTDTGKTKKKFIVFLPIDEKNFNHILDKINKARYDKSIIVEEVGDIDLTKDFEELTKIKDWIDSVQI